MSEPVEQDRRIVILLAQNYQAAVRHAREMELGPHPGNWCWPADAHRIRGVKSDLYRVVACRTFGDHLRRGEITDVLARAGLPESSWSWVD